nr:rps3A [Cryptomonas sp.]
MTIDKNKKLTNTRGGKKKLQDILNRKEWIDVNAPQSLGCISFGKTLINKNTNQSMENSQNRVYEVSLADLNKDEELAFKKLKFKGTQIKDGLCPTNFYGMELTRDKLCSVIRKWQSMIETCLDVKTQDGYFLRIFAIAFSKRRKKQMKKTSYLNSSQKRSIRKKIIEVITKETNDIQLRDVVNKLLSEKINQEIEKACGKVFPLYNIFIRKVKLLNEQ